MKKCFECGKQISENETKCPYCGQEVRQPVCCPKCNSSEIEFSAKEKSSLNWVVPLIGELGKFLIEHNRNNVKLTCFCKNCGFKFKNKDKKKN